MKRLIMQQFLFAVCGIVPLYASFPAATVQISTELAPAGGWAQIKFTLTQPILIASGQIVLNLDPTVFGPIQSAGTFGANGDAYGLATINGESLTAQFYSPSAGIGQLNGLPILVVSVPVLASAAANSSAVTATVTLSDINKNAYSVTVLPGLVTVGGAPFSIQTVPSGMGVLPAGSVVPITGTGFTASTTATIDGVSISSTKFVSSTEIDLTLAAPTELTGKRGRLIDSGVEVDYFCFQPTGPSQVVTSLPFYIVLAGAQPMFPLQASIASSVYTGDLGGVVAVENPQGTPVNVQLQSLDFYGVPEGATSVAIPVGGWGIYAGTCCNSGTSVIASSPVRVVGINRCGLNPSTNCPVSAIPSSAALTPPQPSAIPASVAFQWQIGSAPPGPQTIFVTSTNPVSITASPGAPWLSVTQSSAYNPVLTISVNPAQLTLGTYQGYVIMNSGYGTPPTIPVTLTVTDTAPLLVTANPPSVNFTALASAAPTIQTVAITSTGAAPFSVAVSTPWLVVTPSSGITPAILTVSYDQIANFYNPPQTTLNGAIIIDSPGNSLSIPVQFNGTGLISTQTSMLFSVQAGSSAETQTIDLNPFPFSASVNQPWLSAVPLEGPYQVSVTANPSGLAPGTYNGIVTVTQPATGTFQILVTLAVWSAPPPLQVTPQGIMFVEQAGGAAAAPQSLNVQSGGVPIDFQVGTTASWLAAGDYYSAPTPAAVIVAPPDSPALMPLGQYTADVTLTSPSGAVAVPVTLLITPGPVSQPVLASIVNGASLLPGGVSPGEILTIRGYGAGSSIPTNLQLTSNLQVETTESGAQVLFDGKPAPILYTSAYQTNVVVPYEVQSTTTIQVTYQGLTTTAWGVPVVAAAPAIFTIGATGVGQGAILNQDNSVNSAANPAARGSVIQIYATGEGQTSPAGVTGSVSGTTTKKPLLPVTATIGGVNALVQYAGSAPGEVAGLLQVNVLVPAGVTPGPSVPVSITIGTVQSPAGVTIGVQ